jgi:hypothetical protein
MRTASRGPGGRRPAVAVGVAGASRVGGELGQEALPVPLADTRGSGQGGAGRGLPGGQLRLIDRSDPVPGANRYALIRRRRLLCGVVAWRVRLCGLLAGLVYGHGLGVAGRRPAPADLLHEQVGVSTRATGAMANTSRATGRSGAWAMLKATDAKENSPASAHG